jgi:SAM-dependent methyltransferase
MSSTEPTDGYGYLLKRDFLGSTRLTAQHHILTQHRAALLHPTILSATSLSSRSSSNSPPLEILDLGCGNGIWSNDIISRYGDTVNITALDISSAQFPPPAIRPQNLYMSTWDFFTDVPQQYIGKFDVIHTRFIVPGIVNRPDERHKVMTNMLKMLKSGGWLHWHEPNDPIIQRVDIGEDGRVEETGKPPMFNDILDRFTGLHAKAVEISISRKHDLKQMGFIDVEVMKGEVRKEGLKYETDIVLAGFEEALNSMLGLLPQEEAREAMKKAYKETIDAVKEGALYCTTIEMLAARKP